MSKVQKKVITRFSDGWHCYSEQCQMCKKKSSQDSVMVGIASDFAIFAVGEEGFVKRKYLGLRFCREDFFSVFGAVSSFFMSKALYMKC